MRKMLGIQYSHKQNTTFRKNNFLNPIASEYCSNLINMFVIRSFREPVYSIFDQGILSNSGAVLVAKYIKNMEKTMFVA